MNNTNGSKICISTRTQSATNKAAYVVQTPTKNAEIKGNVHDCKYSKESHSKSQTHNNIEDAKGKETACRCPRPHQSGYSSEIKTGPGQPVDMQYEKPKWLDCFVQGCQKESCFDGVGGFIQNDQTFFAASKVLNTSNPRSFKFFRQISLKNLHRPSIATGPHSPTLSYMLVPIKYPKPGKPCVPEYVHPYQPTHHMHRPQLPEPPEMLSTLKQGIRHPLQITHCRKEMQTRLEKLTDEHQSFTFPPGTKPFDDDAYYFTDPGSSFVENYDLVCRDIRVQQFVECAIRPSLLAFNKDKYKFFRERLPMPEKRVLNIPGNRTTHWHNWIIRPLRTTYSESWRKDIKVPENWFGPAPPSIW